jgi:hypothetical protein
MTGPREGKEAGSADGGRPPEIDSPPETAD